MEALEDTLEDCSVVQIGSSYFGVRSDTVQAKSRQVGSRIESVGTLRASRVNNTYHREYLEFALAAGMMVESID